MRRNDNNNINIINGPIEDTEVTLIEHLTELRRRLIAVFITFTIITLVVFPFSNILLQDFLVTNLLPEDMRMYIYSPIEWLNVQLLFSFLFALSVTIPLILYEIFAFIRSGLYPSERNFFLLVFSPSLCSYALGAFFAHHLVLPLVFSYLITYSGEVAQAAFSAKRIFSISLYAAVGFGLIFQIPFIMTLAVKMKLVTHAWLRDKRLMVYGLIIGIAFFVIADPTGISMLMAVVSIALFELGLLITRCIYRA